MPWTTPRTWVTGEVVTAALMNTHVRDNTAASCHLIDHVYTDVTITNTTTETTLYTFTVPAGAMEDNGILRLKMFGDYLWNSNQTFTPRFKLGSTTLFAVTTTGNLSATRRAWEAELMIHNQNSASAQACRLLWHNSVQATPGGTAFTTGTGNLSLSDANNQANQVSVGVNTVAVNTGSAQALACTIQFGGATSSVEWKLWAASLELMIHT